MKNMKRFQGSLFMLSAVVVLLVSGCVAAPAAVAGPAVVQHTITVNGEGTAYGAPDQVSVQIGVDTFGDTVVAASNQNEDVMQNLFTVIMNEGVQREDIQTSNYSVWTEMTYGDMGYQGIAGYHVSNQVSIIVRDLESLSRVLQVAMDAGANSIYGVTFGVADQQELRSEARQLAVQNAEQIATELAALSGQEIDSILSITEVTGYSGVMDMARSQSGGGGEAPAPSIAPGQISAYVQVQVTYTVK